MIFVYDPKHDCIFSFFVIVQYFLNIDAHVNSAHRDVERARLIQNGHTAVTDTYLIPEKSSLSTRYACPGYEAIVRTRQ